MLPRLLGSQSVFADLLFCWLQEDLFYSPPRLGVKVKGQECMAEAWVTLFMLDSLNPDFQNEGIDPGGVLAQI